MEVGWLRVITYREMSTTRTGLAYTAELSDQLLRRLGRQKRQLRDLSKKCVRNFSAELGRIEVQPQSHRTSLSEIEAHAACRRS